MFDTKTQSNRARSQGCAQAKEHLKKREMKVSREATIGPKDLAREVCETVPLSSGEMFFLEAGS